LTHVILQPKGIKSLYFGIRNAKTEKPIKKYLNRLGHWTHILVVEWKLPRTLQSVTKN